MLMCNTYLKKKHGQQIGGENSSPLLHSHETPAGVLHSALGCPAQERYGPVHLGPEKGHKNGQRTGTPLL